jgi:predicted CoA-binding protein
MKKKVMVLGASSNPSRYSFLAANRLQKNGFEVIAVGKKKGEINGINILDTPPQMQDIDTITLYLNKQNQREYYEYILGLHPKRIIFNPGAENDELAEMAAAKGIQPMEACTLVMLSTGQY